MARLAPSVPSAEELAFRASEGSAPPNLQLLVAHAPQVARLQLELVRAAAAGMTAREKELIILLIGLKTDNAYCWGHHVPPAIAAGLTESEIRAIRAGDHSSLVPRERALLALAGAIADQTVTDALWRVVAADRSPEEMVKITMLVGYYCMLGKIQAALDATQDEGFGGFEQP